MSASATQAPRPHRPLFDLRFGFALMRDRRVPLRSKILATLIALGVTGLVEFLEFPVEGVLAAVLPFLGMAGDVAIDGAELLAGPLILANLLLPFVAPRHIVDHIHAERVTGAPQSPIIDI